MYEFSPKIIEAGLSKNSTIGRNHKVDCPFKINIPAWRDGSVIKERATQAKEIQWSPEAMWMWGRREGMLGIPASEGSGRLHTASCLVRPDMPVSSEFDWETYLVNECNREWLPTSVLSKDLYTCTCISTHVPTHIQTCICMHMDNTHTQMEKEKDQCLHIRQHHTNKNFKQMMNFENYKSTSFPSAW